MQPVSSESVSGESVGPSKDDEYSYNRVAGLAMHPVDQREGVEDRKGGGTTVADKAPPSAFLPVFLVLLPLALLLLH